MSKTLDRLQAVVEAATPGPWRTGRSFQGQMTLWTDHRVPLSGGNSAPEAYVGETRDADATFIATARNTYPEALAVVRAAAELELADAVPAYSWVIESQAARDEGRPNREFERMDRLAAAKRELRAALAAFDEAATRSLP